MVVEWDLMGFYGGLMVYDLIGFYGCLNGFNGILWWFNGIQCDFMVV